MSTEQRQRYVLQHLANERTVLAWMRATLSIAGVGFVLINLLKIDADSPWRPCIRYGTIGLMVYGACIVSYATMYYLRNRRHIHRGGHLCSSPYVGPVYGLFVGILLGVLFLILAQYCVH
ncbi:hypothetical protein AAC03nite_25660 [Alicyclobacillus acidoterrestris]|uniref:YidH family protein n=1 Tax=Alicyclobacillus suci TaxID=2816080 RepID=UPI001194FB49|nr:DUF202 domain-containing protein [Alicyclobacillus suci]GEO26781.1 hypothetical protein AAC03nite_25660 [Alicyclobacillus acidoterrestris]